MGSAVPEALDECTLVIIVWVLRKIVELRQLLRYGLEGVIYDAAPQGTLIEGLQIKASNNTKVV